MIPKEWVEFIPKPQPLVAGKEWNVFIDYRSVNRVWALSLYDVLTELGYKVFIDQYQIKPGDELISNLQKALNNAQASILIWSKATTDSRWVENEYARLEKKAYSHPDFVFVPVVIDNTPLPIFATSRVYIDFSAYPEGPNGGELIRLLFAINGRPLSDDALRLIIEFDESSKDQLAKVDAAIKNGNNERLRQLFDSGGIVWRTSAAIGCKAAEGLIRLRQYDDAILMLDKLCLEFKKALRPKQLKAMALARRGASGDLEQAQEILAEMYVRNETDSETLGIYARTWMDRYAKSNDINDLIQSRDLYAEAFEKAPDDYYTGINAASKSVFIGTEKDLEKAADYAARVEKITLTKEVVNDYWKTATIAEVFLIQKKYKEAADMYEKAIVMARSEIGSHESTFTEAKRLMDKLRPSEEERQMIVNVFRHLSVQRVKSVRVFISYSQSDSNYLEELLQYLLPLEQAGTIELLFNQKIKAGEIWDEKLDQFIRAAEIIIFLVSPDSIRNSSINSEIQTALGQFNNGISIVIPIEVKAISWDASPLSFVQFLAFRQIPVRDSKSQLNFENKITWYREFVAQFERLITEMGQGWFAKVKTEIIQRTGHIELGNCNLTEVPFIVTRMDWLRELKLPNNSIRNVESLANIINLEILDLSVNEISKIKGINQLPKLVSLNLSSNSIGTSSNEFDIPNLIRLFLRNCKLKHIPDMSKLPHLNQLDLSSNQIKKIERLINLDELKSLMLTDNLIEKIEGLNNLNNLEQLDLYKNHISIVENLEDNLKLKLLGLSSNKINELKNIGHLQNLETLYIANNNIEDISQLQGLPRLKRAILTNNKITDLIYLKRFIEQDIPVKAEYSFDTNEIGFFVKDNPIQYPPLEVLQQGKDAILRNFKQQDDALLEQLDAYQSNDVKLILIGNANVGKTHIATYIKSKKRDLPLNNASTHGMVNEFAEYHMPSLVKMRILDFGGQEYYHDTHHLFFTMDTVYLLLWEKKTNKFGTQTEKRFSVKTGKEEEETNAIFPIAYWLDAVNYFINKTDEENINTLERSQSNADPVPTSAKSIDPSVILVETKRDKKGATLLDTASILSYRGIIHSQVSISLYRDVNGAITTVGTDSLFDSLNGLISSMFEKRWSGYYKLIVAFFENIDSEDSISLIKRVQADSLIVDLHECITLFNEIIHASSFKYKFDDDNGLDLCQFLANRGYILFFDSNKICLHPEKLTKEIYAILNKEYNNIGIITESEATYHNKIVLNIMQDFKLLIPHPDGKSFIAPQLLPEDTSSQLKMFLEAFKSPVIRFSIVGYIHKNIIQELFYSFREKLMQNDTQNYIWKNGFIIRIENELYKINIISCEGSRLIEVQYLNSLNMNVLNDISNVISKVLGKRLFKKEVSVDGKFFVPVKLIEESIQLSQFIYESKLLRVAEYKNFLNEEANKYAMKKLFISYSSKNTDFMKRFVTHLEPLRRNGTINFWHDRMIEPGIRWDESIKTELKLSDIVIFLLSPDFIATDYIFEVEIPQALKQFEDQKDKLFFIELQSCSWEQTILAQYQQTTDPNADNKGVIIINEPANDLEWKKVIRELQKKIALIKS